MRKERIITIWITSLALSILLGFLNLVANPCQQGLSFKLVLGQETCTASTATIEKIYRAGPYFMFGAMAIWIAATILLIFIAFRRPGEE